MSARTAYTIRRAHKILALVVGLQFLFWTASGLFFTIFPIEQIRGEHLVDRSLKSAPALTDVSLVNPATILGAGETVTLRRGATGPVYEVLGEDIARVHDAVSGVRITPLKVSDAMELANLYWTGEGILTRADIVVSPPREAGSASPLWRVQFDGKDTATLWIDPDRARLKAVRTTNWRIFDVLWRFHIMDITGADRFDSWWLRIFAFLALTTVLFGIALLIDRAWRGILLK